MTLYAPPTDTPLFDLEQIEARLTEARTRLATAEWHSTAANARASANTIQDPAALSGIRRKPNRKADDRRFGSYAAAADAWKRVEKLRGEVRHLELELANAVEDRDRVRFTPEDLAGASHVADEFGWHKVVKVNRKTVTVETAYSWNDLIPVGKVLRVYVESPVVTS